MYTCSSESSSGVFTDSSDSSGFQVPHMAKPSIMVKEVLFNFEELSEDEESEGEVFVEPLAKPPTMPHKVPTVPRKVTTMPRMTGKCDLSAYNGKSRDLPTDTRKSQSTERQTVAPNHMEICPFRPRSTALDPGDRKLTKSHSEPRFSLDKLPGNVTLVGMQAIPEMESVRKRRATKYEIAAAHQPLRDIHISSPQLQPQAIAPTTSEDQMPKGHPEIKITLGADKVIKADMQAII